MDFAAPMGFNASVEAIDADRYPDIRLYTVQKCRGGSPHQCARRGPGPSLELLNASFSGQRWVPASKSSVFGSTAWTKEDYSGWEAKIGQTAGGKGFSAACWYFGKEVYKVRKYPIGLIWSSIGGTPDEVSDQAIYPASQTSPDIGTRALSCHFLPTDDACCVFCRGDDGTYVGLDATGGVQSVRSESVESSW